MGVLSTLEGGPTGGSLPLLKRSNARMRVGRASTTNSVSEFHEYLHGQPAAGTGASEGTTATPAESISLPVGQRAAGQTQTLYLRCPGSSLPSTISRDLVRQVVEPTSSLIPHL